MKVRDFPTRLGGTSIELCPERAVYRPYRSELIVSDLELGAASAWHRKGRTTAGPTTHDELDRLGALIDRKGAERLTILGHVFHEEVGPRDTAAISFQLWLRGHRDLNVAVVLSQEDRAKKQFLSPFPIEVRVGPIEAEALRYRHTPCHTAGDECSVPEIAGSLAPSVQWKAADGEHRLPAFYRRGESLILPAFGSRLNPEEIEARLSDQVMAVTPTGIIGMPNVSVLDRSAH